MVESPARWIDGLIDGWIHGQIVQEMDGEIHQVEVW